MKSLAAGLVVLGAVASLVAAVPAASAPVVPSAVASPLPRQVAVQVPGAKRFVTSSKQAIVVSAARDSSTHAVLTAYERSGKRWHKVMRAKARLGANGLVLGNKRKQGSMKTPAGIYYLTQSFGLKPNPGTSLPYTKIGSDHYWVGDNSSPFYNEMRLGSQGGFKRKASEHMISYNPEYNYGVVIDFNRPNPVRGRGFAIFLHVNGPGATAGCVSVGSKQMKALLRWLKPTETPVIAIGRKSWLNPAR